MNAEHERLNRLLAEIDAGRLDALAPDDVTWLETQVNAAPALLADRPAGGRPMSDRVAPLDPATSIRPTAREWDDVWAGIERRGAGRRHGGVWRALRTATALAACIALALLWRFSAPALESGESWNMSLASQVEIQAVEVYGDAFSAINYSGDNGGPVVIWVFEDAKGV